MTPEATKPPFSSSTIRPLFRTRSIIVLTTAAATAALVLRYKSNAIKDNELAQRTQKAPNGYVSVDRSGGGI